MLNAARPVGAVTATGSTISLYISESFRWIAAELGRALSCCKGDPSSQWEQPIFGGLPPKTIGAIKIKSSTNDYVGEGNPHAKFGNILITGGFSPYR